MKNACATWTTCVNLGYGVFNTARPVESRKQEMHSAIEAFERRITWRLYAVGITIVLAEALLRRLWT